MSNRLSQAESLNLYAQAMRTYYVNKGYDFIDTELHTMRTYEKEVNGWKIPVCEVIK